MRRFSAALLAFFSCAAAAGPTAAQIDRRAEELADVEERLKDRAAEEKRLKNEVEEREKEVASLRYRMIETANSLQESEKTMSEIVGELARLSEEAGRLDTKLKAEQETLGDVLAGLQSLEMSRPPALLVSPGDANKAARAAILLADAAPTLEAESSCSIAAMVSRPAVL